MRRLAKTLVLLLVVAGAVLLGTGIHKRLQKDDAPRRRGSEAHAAPVEVAAVTRGPIELRRTFTGTLETTAELIVAPKIAGRVKALFVDLSDVVKRGQVVARLDDEEFQQAVAQAQADLAVAKANLAEATSALEIAERALQRVQTLRERGVASESQLDVAKAEELAKQAAVKVAQAQVTRAEAALETARIRLGYTRITAMWTGGDDERVVAERYVDEGATVAANARLLSVVELDPIHGVVYVQERDYGRLAPGQVVELATDAYPDGGFKARVDRIAPTFRRETRQARVELTIENPKGLLKPGMFIRATVVLERFEKAVLIPEAALTKRKDKTGVFLVKKDGAHVAWRPLRVGIHAGGLVQVLDEAISGRVVTLGQQLLDDGSAIVVPADARPGKAEE